MVKTCPLVILLIALVGVFVLLMIVSSYDYVPYNSTQSNYARYEQMTPMVNTPLPDVSSHIENVEKPEEEEKLPSAPENVNVEQPMFMSPHDTTENFAPIIDVARTIQYSPFRDSEIIDKFSQVTKNGVDGVDGCVSSGLSNSGGHICLTPDLIKLLKSRGGNASGEEK